LLSENNFLGKAFFGLTQDYLVLLKSRFQNLNSLLKHRHTLNQLIYLSAVPHQISAYAGISAAQTADILARKFSIHASKYRFEACSSSMPDWLVSRALEPFDIQATPSGYLEFRIKDWAIAHWLTELTQPVASLFASSTPHSLSNSDAGLIQGLQHLFPVQHAHARCCSLLCLAYERGVIELSFVENSPEQWQWEQPQPIPWLTTIQRLCTDHPAEQQLISQCLMVMDELSWQPHELCENSQFSPPNSAQILTLAQNLSQAFQVMHQQCQIWGALQEEGRDRLTAHVALIFITQRLLYGLLHLGLRVAAPSEL
jgi:hypothetical protein